MEEIVEYLKANYDEMKVAQMLDLEIVEWVDENWADYHDSEYDWYIDHMNGQAEDEIRSQIIKDIKNKFPNLDESIDLDDVVRELYELLDN
jgi:hypothetical protein